MKAPLARNMLITVLGLLLIFSGGLAADDKFGSAEYDDFETAEFCGSSCHIDFHAQWEMAMMSQCYVHHWDEIEYFELAVPHAEKDTMVAGVKAGCNGCHAPLAYVAGDVPPPRPEEGSMANEGVSCEVCHNITGMVGDTAYNHNWVMDPGDVKYGTRATGESPGHEVAKSEFMGETEFCGTCHNEKSPYGAWVKATQLEWLEGPYAEKGTRCHDCHMTYTEARTAEMGETYANAALHYFPGAHDPVKVKGTIELQMYPDVDEIEPGMPVVLKMALFNGKTGHKFPTGSVEDRIVWLHVEATDEAGNVYHLPVDEKGFEGEHWTIATDDLGYQDMALPMEQPDFEGVRRDGDVPVGDRIYRMPYLDPQGRITIMQWNTKSFGVDYRIGPLETKTETFTFDVPADASPGVMTVTATLNYQRLVPSVGRLLNVPAEEWETIVVNQTTTEFEILP